MEFMIGCNYWASNAGTEMWRAFDENIIREDLRILTDNKIKHLRIFPIWRDFQPIKALTSWAGMVSGYCQADEKKSKNPYFLDETMLSRFKAVLDICAEFNLKVIVGIVTGWMSGAMFCPPALNGKALISDPLAQYFEQLYIKGFVTRFKDHPAIAAWDMGNECNCLEVINDRYHAGAWTAMITNAIRSADASRPILSGLQTLDVNSGWTISDQAEFCDMLTTHPYPFFTPHGTVDRHLSLRTSLLPTAATKFCAEIGGKPCMAEELGTLGPTFCSDENSARFLKINAFSLWANGSTGLLWWCANEQSHLNTFPYTNNMLETELGMIYADRTPKPTLKEMKRFSELLDTSLDFELPPAQTDAVILTTNSQDQWGIGYMTYILTKLAGLNCRFAYADIDIPDAKLYIMPSVKEAYSMRKDVYEKLKDKIRAGAELYVSNDSAVLSDFEELFGMRIADSFSSAQSHVVRIGEETIDFSTDRVFITEPTTASVLLKDDGSNPFLTVNRYGEGTVYYVNAPIEKDLLNKHNAPFYKVSRIYRLLFEEHLLSHPLTADDSEIFVTYHPTDDGVIVVMLNHTDSEKQLNVALSPDYAVEKIFYGGPETIAPFDACILKIIKK